MVSLAYIARSYTHQSIPQAVDAFISTADVKFGPIIQIRHAGQKTQKVPWAAFQLDDEAWKRVKLCAEILAVCSID